MRATSDNAEIFRDEFRGTVPAGYSGVRHGLIILFTGLAAIALCSAFFEPAWRWRDFVVVPLVVLAWNWVEWYVHKKVLHRPGKGAVARALYTRHTLTHHRFFTLDDADLRDARDLKIVFFPAFAQPAILVMAGVPALAAGWLISRNAGLLVVIGTAAMYLLFEAMHLFSHLPQRRWLDRFPLVNTMRRHHRAHHDQGLMMSHNMNFTLPWADWYFDTSDVERGFWGTTFNGSSSRHVRPAQERPAPPSDAHRGAADGSRP
ncbi:sterol desaturase family protein [Variovorax sp. KK3]|uniref:sterol desaturase family protein n=1 Tax=Variovorax sp. KK3 TaxID=1855728 RepID=UPI00097BC755|nr:sterol desaturase family protein [Variovorax sp. KK3]